MRKKYIKTKWLLVIISIMIMMLLSINIGTIKVPFKELLRALIWGGNSEVEIIRMVRLPRIFISIFTGSMLAVSGVLLQSVMKNPLADPGIIGISAGANFASSLVLAFMPKLFFSLPLFGVIGGFVASFLVYELAFKRELNPVRIILAGVAVNALFEAASELVGYMTSNSMASMALGNQSTVKGWDTVFIMSGYGFIFLILAMLLYKKCNLLALGDKNAASLGLNVTKVRLLISVVAIFLAIIPTVQVGMISFVGLIVPHLARLLVGTDHKVLIPFTAFLGASLVLFADLLSRMVAYPFEIPISIMMAIIGAPFFLYMLKRSDTFYAS